MKPAEWGLTLAFDPMYRGHARGFHFFFNEALALALIFANLFAPKARTKLFPPGLWVYLLYCFVSMISLINAPSQAYALMASLKAFKIILFFIAAYNFFRQEEDFHFFLKVMSYTMIWEMFVVLKMKYVDRLYQVWGTFEHQNSLVMYASMIGMVLLAAAAARKHRNANIYLFGFIATGVITQSTLSRAGVVIFAAGTVGVVVLSLLEKVSRRRLAVAGALVAVAVVGLSFTLDSIVARFNDSYNSQSGLTRDHLNLASAKMLHDYPLGVGLNNYGVMINHPYPYGDHIDEYERVELGHRIDKTIQKGISESIYWLVLAETGYLGFVTFIAFLLVYLWWAVRNAWHFRRQFIGALSMGIAMGFSLNYTQSLLERVLLQPRNMMVWFILLAAVAKIHTWRKQSKRRSKKSLNELSPSIGVPQERQLAAARVVL
ncbi:MAG: hypothetical protein H0X66_13815 [Verrucomicrobia bacterium]|nr:hypothetical protein [Verrucomicrobiota bacterium]